MVKYRRIYIGSTAVGVTLLSFFIFMISLGANIVSDGDTFCEGTFEDPCISFINITVPVTFYIYNKEGINLDFSPKIKDYDLYIRDKRYTKTCIKDVCGWRPFDLTKKKKGFEYVYKFYPNKVYELALIGYKNNYKDTIKWGIGASGGYLDPYWYGFPVGYEFLDNDSVVHMWNKKYDYYFNKSSGIQFTNNYEDYWSKNVFCLGYYNGDTWIKIKCADELSDFNSSIETDNLTYVNYTLWKDFNFNGSNLRLAVRYSLGVDDPDLSVIFYAKNLDNQSYPYPLGFAWKIQDLNIPPPNRIDSILINDTNYSLNGVFDKTFKNMTKNITKGLNDTGEKTEQISFLTIYDKNKFLKVDWDSNLNYAVKMFGNGNQDNFYVAVLVNVGNFGPGQEKQTIFHWIDAETIQNDDGAASTFYSGVAAGTIYASKFNATTTEFPYQIMEAPIQFYNPNSEPNQIYTMHVYGDGSTPGDELVTPFNDTFTTYYSGWYNVNFTSYDIYITSGQFWIGVELVYPTGDTTAGPFPLDDGQANLPSNSYRKPPGGSWTEQSEGDEWMIRAIVEHVNDTWYPQFSNYWDDNASLAGDGTGNFNVTVENTTGLVYLEINGENITATNLTSNMYNASYTFTDDGVYLYRWHSWGNGTVGLYNQSSEQNYTVNISYGWLNVSIQKPDEGSGYSQYDTNLSINASVTCSGSGSNLKCGTIYALSRYNLTTNPDTAINATTGADPFYIYENTGEKQRLINLTSNPGNFSYMNISYYNNMNSTFSDVYFIDYDKTLEYNFTLQNKSDGNWAIFRINNLGQTSFWMIYGNSSLYVSKSNVSATHYEPKSCVFMDETSGSIAVDYCGYLNGTIVGDVTVNQPSSVGTQYDFENTTIGGDYVKFTAFGTPASNSIVLRANVTEFPTSGWRFFWFGGLANWNIQRIYTDYGKDRKVRLGFYESDGFQPVILSDDNITLNQEFVIGVTFGTPTMKMYIDGVLQADTNDTYTGDGVSGQTDKYLGSGTTQSYSQNATIDEYFYWEKELTASEFAAMSNYTTPGFSIGEEQFKPNSTNQVSSFSVVGGQTFEVYWLLNITTSSVVNYLLDVFFNSSYGNSNVPDNNTDDKTVILNQGAVSGNPDLNFSIWNSTDWIYADTEDINFACTVTQTQCEPTNQDTGSSQSIYQVCNNGTGAGTSVDFKMDVVCPNIALLCDDDYTYTGAITLTTSDQQIHGGLAIDSCVDISCWADYSSPTAGCYFDINATIN